MTEATAVRTITIGHTPDMDDAFMFYGIAHHGNELNGLRFAHVIEDIQALNRRALKGDLDMTAVSAASFPALADQYWLVTVGSSVGQGYGPLVIATTERTPQSLSGKRVAVPGALTTACMLLELAVPDVRIVEVPFSDIPHAVTSGKVDAGLVIHEWQLTYRDAGLHPVLDLGVWWQQETRLPIPLGLNLVKRSLGRSAATRVATAFRDSILYAFAHREEAMAYAMAYARGTDAARSTQFIEMYVNEDSLAFSPQCREALRLLYTLAHEAELIPKIPRIEYIEPEKG